MTCVLLVLQGEGRLIPCCKPAGTFPAWVIEACVCVWGLFWLFADGQMGIRCHSSLMIGLDAPSSSSTSTYCSYSLYCFAVGLLHGKLCFKMYLPVAVG